MRAVSEYAEEESEVAFPVINMEGSAGTVGLEDLNERPADGYNIGMVHDGLMVAHHTDVTDLNYDDFQPLAGLAETPQILAASADAPFDTFEEFEEYFQENPGEVDIGTTLQGIAHVWAEQLADQLDSEFNYVGYEGLGEAIQATAGGHVDVTITDYPSASEFVEAGDMKFLASGTEEPMEEIPETPTFSDYGYELDFLLIRGIVGPEGMEEEHVAALEDIFERVSENEGFQEELDNLGMEATFLDSEEFETHLSQQDEMVIEVVDDILDEE